jgi:transposase
MGRRSPRSPRARQVRRHRREQRRQGRAARAALETLPEAHLDERALDIRLLSDHREDLVAARTEDQQRLRWHLHDLWPELEIPACALDTGKWLAKLSHRLARAEQTVRVRVARELVRQIAAHTTSGKSMSGCARYPRRASVSARRPRRLSLAEWFGSGR